VPRRISWAYPAKGAGEEFLKLGLVDFGILGRFINESVRHDELDAITSALVGYFFSLASMKPSAVIRRTRSLFQI
jgi:hypothetical protein